MDVSAVKSSYARYAPFYDRTFGWMLGHHARRMATVIPNLRPGRVLELGVGTGLSLPSYGPEQKLTGIDISPEMLDVARKRVAQEGLGNVEAIEEMDAEALTFEDDSFDCVVAMYMITTAPHPDRVMSEIKRVLKPDGDIVILSHFASDYGVRQYIERMMTPVSMKLGWRPHFPIENVLNDPDLVTIRRTTLPPIDLFTLLHLKFADA